ncbi:MAG: HAD family hydrolase [Chlamydiales bacterium]|nr:HAD family hydrolase [Chlamydiales bacterium]
MSNNIAIIFDFDDTLAPDSTTGYLRSQGVDMHKFWKEDVQQLIDQDWDPIPAYLHRMIELSKNGDIPPITAESMKAWAKSITYYPGVLEIFDRLRNYAKKNYPLLNLEFYLISSGVGSILRETSIAHHFQDIWSCDFAFDANGGISFPKRIVSFTDKTRYIFHIAKGIFGERSRGRPFDVNRKIDSHDLRIPSNQMIFVGDGYTDIPCFALIRKGGGIAIGVYDTNNMDKWGRAWGFIEQQRVSNLVPADYSDRSALSNSLIMAVESMARRIELNQIAYQS